MSELILEPISTLRLRFVGATDFIALQPKNAKSPTNQISCKSISCFCTDLQPRATDFDCRFRLLNTMNCPNRLVFFGSFCYRRVEIGSKIGSDISLVLSVRLPCSDIDPSLRYLMWSIAFFYKRNETNPTGGNIIKARNAGHILGR